MFWWLWKLLWWPRWKYDIAVGTSHASAEEAEKNALIQAGKLGGEVIGIAASAMCCSGQNAPSDGGAPAGAGSAEWDVYLLLRK